jgi:D-3-phosphoglycerate dehydrogenase
MRAVYVDCSMFIRDLMDDEIRSILPQIDINVGDPDQDSLKQLISGATGIINGHTYMDRALLKDCTSLRTIVFLGTGASSYIDVSAAEELGIRVRIIRSYGDRTIAEHAFTLILAAARGVAAMDRGIRAGKWDPLAGIELNGKRLGVIGTGAVGTELIRMASAFGMETCAWSRRGVPSELPCKSVTLDELLKTSDVISLHLALNSETKGFLNSSRLAMLRRGAILVNTARGALVDEAALVEALRTNRIAHAALDVFETEPLRSNHELGSLPNVTLTAHAAFKTREASYRLTKMGFELLRADIDAIASGKALESPMKR